MVYRISIYKKIKIVWCSVWLKSFWVDLSTINQIF